MPARMRVGAGRSGESGGSESAADFLRETIAEFCHTPAGCFARAVRWARMARADARRIMTGKPHVVILGGGFGGLWAARSLARAPVRITLVDRSNHHLFQPLLYQVATAGLSAPDIAA